MKKAAVLLSIIPIFLCSCSNSNEPEKICVNQIFTEKVNIQFNETAFTADFTSDENGCSAVFLSPEEINGLKISTDGNNTVYSLGEMSFESEGTNEQTRIINAIYSAITSLPDIVQKTESNYILQGTDRYGKYVMNIDASTLTPTFIEYDELDLTVTFSSDA